MTRRLPLVYTYQ